MSEGTLKKVFEQDIQMPSTMPTPMVRATTTMEMARGQIVVMSVVVVSKGQRQPLYRSARYTHPLVDKTDTYNELQIAAVGFVGWLLGPWPTSFTTIPTHVGLEILAEICRWLGETTTPNLNTLEEIPEGGLY